MGLGPMELVIILGIALLIFGPSRLPGLGKSLGDAIRGFKQGIDGKDEEVRKEQLTESERQNESQKQSDKNKV